MPAPLNFHLRAELFQQLAALEQAGLSTDRALSLTRLPPQAQRRLADMRKRLSLGQGIAEAGLHSGLFTSLESALVNAACNAGSPARTYRRLAEHYARQAARAARMKSRLMLPLAMLVIGDFAGPLPRVFAGTLGPGAYLLKCLLPLLALAAAAYLLKELPRRLRTDSPLMRQIPLDQTLIQLPWFGPMLVRRNVRDFLESLALLVEAGMPILDGLPIAVSAMHNQAVRLQFDRIRGRIEGGASFTQALGELSFPGRDAAHAVIGAGEASGRLPEALFRVADGESAAIDSFDEQVAQWFPRVVYTLAAVWLARGIMHSGAFMPSLPQDLR